MLSLKNVRKKYFHQWVLKDINITFENKGFVSILGASGSGKSTLLNLIGGLEKVSEGSIYFKEHDITRFNNKELNLYLSNNVSFIFQQYNLIGTMTVLENIKLVTTEHEAKKILKKLNIENLADKKVSLLSGGEQQRVAIARAIIRNTDILLCDEPTGALDMETSEQILEILKELSKKKLIIVVTHNAEQAIKYSDRIIKISDGNIIEDNKSDIKKNIIKKEKKSKRIKHNIYNIVKNNLLSKLKRNILTIISFSIGLIALFIVLGIKNGFPISLEKCEQEDLATYPIYISKYSKDLDQELADVFNEKKEKNVDNKILSFKSEHENKIDLSYIIYLNKASSYLAHQENIYYIKNKTIRTYRISSYFKNSINIIAGKLATKDNEVIIMVDNNNVVESSLLYEIGLKKEKYDYDDILGYKYRVDNKLYEIVGIVQGKENTIYYDLSAIMYKENNFKKYIPDELYLYPNDFIDKQLLKQYLNDYKDKVYYTDYASSIKNISVTFMDGLSIILIAFSVISLLVATIMIGVLNYISVIERTKDIGIYKSLGYKVIEIKKMFVYENLIIIILSCFISVLIVLLLSIIINNVLYDMTGLIDVLKLDLNSIISVLLLSTILGVIGSYFPLKSIRRYSITETLKYE